jgi:hypothetical protein
MRIGRPDPENSRNRRSELDDAAKVRLVEGRICGANCTAVCPQCGAVNCQCQCSVDCPDAPAMMSEDPVREPIEPGVAPLVFAMKRLELFQPCWSCEGHTGLDGALWKLPKVWFYAKSMVGVRLLSDGVKALEQDKRLNGRWHVAVTFSDPDNVDTTFSLEPVTPIEGQVELADLQRDLDTIARALPGMIGSEANRLLREQAGERP